MSSRQVLRDERVMSVMGLEVMQNCAVSGHTGGNGHGVGGLSPELGGRF